MAASVLIVGAGRLGSALARGFAAAGWEVAGHARSARGRARLRRLRVPSVPLARAAEFDLLFLAVPDREVEAVARELAPRVARRQVVAHGAGALSLEPLASLRRRGAHPGSLHPVQALAGGRLEHGTTAALDGDAVALRLLRRAAADLRLSPVRVPERGRVLYHAAAAIAANLCMALADMASEAWTASGAPAGRALAALVPLLRSAVENLAANGLPGALTGPASRGDAEVVARHLATLRGDAAEVYRLLSLRLVDLAGRGRGGWLEAEQQAALRSVLRRPRRRRRSGHRRPTTRLNRAGPAPSTGTMSPAHPARRRPAARRR